MSSESAKKINPCTAPIPEKELDTIVVDSSNPVPNVAKGLTESQKLTKGEINSVK